MSFAVDSLQGKESWLNRASVPVTNVTPARAHSARTSVLLWGNTNATKHGYSTAAAWRHEPSSEGNCFQELFRPTDLQARHEKQAGSKGLHGWSWGLSIPEPPAKKSSECWSCHFPLPEVRTQAAGGAGQRTSGLGSILTPSRWSPGLGWGADTCKGRGFWKQTLTLTEGTTAVGGGGLTTRYLLKST